MSPELLTRYTPEFDDSTLIDQRRAALTFAKELLGEAVTVEELIIIARYVVEGPRNDDQEETASGERVDRTEGRASPEGDGDVPRTERDS
jgi:hypothetical protein